MTTPSWAESPEVERILEGMSLEQKVSQMLLVGVPEASEIPIHAGGVIFLGNQLRNLDQVKPRVEALQARAPVPPSPT